MKNAVASNQAVIKALGLENEKSVIAMNIRLRVDQIPTVVIWRHLPGLVGADVQRFRLVPEGLDVRAAGVLPGLYGAAFGWAGDGCIGEAYMRPKETKPFDLDRMCAEAKERLRDGIARHVVEQHVEWRKACVDRAYRAAIREAIEKSLGNLLKEMMTTSRQGGSIL